MRAVHRQQEGGPFPISFSCSPFSSLSLHLSSWLALFQPNWMHVSALFTEIKKSQ